MSLGSIADSDNLLLASTTVGARKSISNIKTTGKSRVQCRSSSVTTSEMGLTPSGDPVTDQKQLQDFIDNIASDGVTGIIEAGHWFVHRKLILHDGVRVCGRGMERTIIEARTEDWRQDDYVMMYMQAGDTINRHGVFLSDFCAIGADKQATHNGPLIRLGGITNFLIERVRVEDGSSGGIFVTGYGIGKFTNDIRSPFWNSTHRGIIRQCHIVRGFIGIECEGGAENVLIIGNHTDGQKLHGFRLASAYNTQLIANSAINTRNAYWIDRHEGIHILHNSANNVERGCVYGGFDQKRDERISKGLWIIGNQFKSSKSTITDAYQGTSDKFTRIVKIKDNLLEGGHIRLLWSRQVDIQGNDGDGSNAIITSHAVSGFIGNNFMRLRNKSEGVMDLGNNLHLD